MDGVTQTFFKIQVLDVAFFETGCLKIDNLSEKIIIKITNLRSSAQEEKLKTVKIQTDTIVVFMFSKSGLKLSLSEVSCFYNR